MFFDLDNLDRIDPISVESEPDESSGARPNLEGSK